MVKSNCVNPLLWRDQCNVSPMNLFIAWIARIAVLSFLIMACVSEAHAEVWDGLNDPSQFDLDQSYQTNFAALPLHAALKTPPWSETYWPSYRGSINIRWSSPGQDGFNYSTPTLTQAKAMSIDQLKQLSPTEKYDLYLGKYDYPIHTEVKRYTNLLADQYTGLCDGWAIASTQYAEPKPITLANPDGILIPFGSSDVKALMTFAAEYYFARDSSVVGKVCMTSPTSTPAEIAQCSGMNAGAMHLILSNEIGLKGAPFIARKEPFNQIWHQPVSAYDSAVTGSALSNVPGATGVQVRTVLTYSEDLDESFWNPVIGTANFHSNHINMDYILDVDANGDIMGGTWTKGSQRPGYFWRPIHHLTFSGKWSGLNQIYRAQTLKE